MDLHFRRRLLPPPSLRRGRTVSFVNDGVTYRRALAYSMRKGTRTSTQPSFKLLVLNSNKPDERSLNETLLSSNLSVWMKTFAGTQNTGRSSPTNQPRSLVKKTTSSVSSKAVLPLQKQKSRVKTSAANVVKTIKYMFKQKGENIGCLNTLLSLVSTGNSLILRELALQNFCTLVELRDKLQYTLNQKKENQRLLITFNHLPNGKRCIVIKLVAK